MILDVVLGCRFEFKHVIMIYSLLQEWRPQDVGPWTFAILLRFVIACNASISLALSTCFWLFSHLDVHLKLFFVDWCPASRIHRVSHREITRRRVTLTQPCSIDVSTVPWHYSVGTKLLKRFCWAWQPWIGKSFIWFIHVYNVLYIYIYVHIYIYIYIWIICM